jgi:prepilin-type N-terminal cleavage/methylation domain-containing protein
MSRRMTAPGFSLVEVILAVAIFALSVPTTLALISALGRQGAMETEALIAQRLPDSVRLELARLARTDFDGLAAMMPVMTTSPAPGLVLAATRDGCRLNSCDYLPPLAAVAAADQYFLVECWRFEEEPLRFDAQKAFLAVAVRISWPYHLPHGPVAAAPPVSVITFTVVLNR